MSAEIRPFRIDIPELKLPDHFVRDLREPFGKVRGGPRRER